ncbi:hypothetical protein GCM10014715_65070 [Streptomyces spiralis]|uniref:Uncharacterized protein n=1 Tax=Streptomyces spiralis TaxID=66376 RepID=A0A919AFH7_9ACTN|nr:hypothetical protein [Streptomyces spiralis]GHE99888.1 hypothetical protein GCM10014715_65070 [Streptomyces spiralis]
MSEQTQDQRSTVPPMSEEAPPLPTQAPVVPPAPREAPVLPGAPAAPPAVPAPPVKDRRRLRAVLRWTAAVVVFAVAGTGTAYGITRMDRTDVPGLATASDGRWDYPEIVRPPLPSGSPAPFADSNAAGAHHADLRALLLPAPRGAREDKALRGTGGWLAKKDFLAEYARPQDRTELAQQLTDHGLRHIAARGWTSQDGTHTRIYLLQFDTAAVVDDLAEGKLLQYDSPGYALRGAGTSVFDADFPIEARNDDIPGTYYVESKPYGAEQVRQAYLRAGDVLAVVVQSRKGAARAVPFQQTVTLQSELLG